MASQRKTRWEMRGEGGEAQLDYGSRAEDST
jgi:hypothetical protein